MILHVSWILVSNPGCNFFFRHTFFSSNYKIGIICLLKKTLFNRPFLWNLQINEFWTKMYSSNYIKTNKNIGTAKNFTNTTALVLNVLVRYCRVYNMSCNYCSKSKFVLKHVVWLCGVVVSIVGLYINGREFDSRSDDGFFSSLKIFLIKFTLEE